MSTQSITAALLVIGDEILSGRTKDKNIGYIAEYLTALGIDLREVRVVPDVEAEIVAAVNALRHRYTYLFTTGGIGPTHDDITADAVGAAFGRPVIHDPRALAILHARYKPEELTEARLRMARMPEGSELVANPISKAPGFRTENVIVMAGVPQIMQVMLDAAAPTLRTGVKMLSREVGTGGLPEGVYADALGAIAKAHPGVIIGSYPSFDGKTFNNRIVMRARDESLLPAVEKAVHEAMARLHEAQGTRYTVPL